MNEAYLILARMFEVYSANNDLKALVSAVYTQAQKPKGKKNPAIMMWIEGTESAVCGVLTDAVLNIVIRSDNPDGFGSELANIFEVVDVLTNGVHYEKNSVSCTFRRSGVPVPFGIFDEVEKDYFKHWRYRCKIKRYASTRVKNLSSVARISKP